MMMPTAGHSVRQRRRAAGLAAVLCLAAGAASCGYNNPAPVVDVDPPLNDVLLVVVRSMSEKDEAKERPLLDGEPRWVEIKLPESTQPIIKSGDKWFFAHSMEGP